MEPNRLPEITLSARDLSRLDLLTGFVVAYRTPVKDMLARELRRARVVPPHALPAVTVRMRSTVRYRDGETGATRIVTLVYPGEEERADDRVSVLTPVGSALIGLSEGQSIAYEDADGRAKTLTVLDVMPPPEASRDQASSR